MVSSLSSSSSRLHIPEALFFFILFINANILMVYGFEYSLLEEPIVGGFPIDLDVRYQCVITNLWTSSRHPNSYPQDAHWQTPVVASHKVSFSIWSPELLASHGLERYVETGTVNPLIIEILNGGSETGDIRIGSKFETNDSDETQLTLPPFKISSNHPLITSVMKFAPSPDWFTGFYDFAPYHPTSSRWYSSFSIETFPFDAGTETGDKYRSGNPPEMDQLPIQRILPDADATTNVFLSSDGTFVRPVARWTCTLNEVLVSRISRNNTTSSTTTFSRTTTDFSTSNAGPADESLMDEFPPPPSSSNDYHFSAPEENNVQSPDHPMGLSLGASENSNSAQFPNEEATTTDPSITTNLDGNEEGTETEGQNSDRDITNMETASSAVETDTSTTVVTEENQVQVEEDDEGEEEEEEEQQDREIALLGNDPPSKCPLASMKYISMYSLTTTMILLFILS